MKKNAGQGEFNHTLPIRNLNHHKTREQRIISYMLEESRLQESENNYPQLVNLPTMEKEQAQLEALKKQVQLLKDKDAVHRLTISKISSENQQLKQELAQTNRKLQRQQGLMRADRVYIQTLDREVRRLKELSAKPEEEQPDNELQEYEKQNAQLLKEVEQLMQTWLNASSTSVKQAPSPSEPLRLTSRSGSKKRSSGY